MCAIMQRIADEAASEAAREATRKAEQALKEKDFNTVRNLLNRGFSFDDAFQTAGVSTFSFEELRQMIVPT